MLRRPLNDNEAEYEIQDSTKDIEQMFYEYFLDYVKRIKLDIIEYQIIVNPLAFTMEIRIRMKKLYRCFAYRISLDELIECRYGEKSFMNICEAVIKPVKDYATSLCYKD